MASDKVQAIIDQLNTLSVLEISELSKALQEAWAATATTWFPSQSWRLRPGPEIVAVQAYDAEAGTATCELWLPVEPAAGA